MQPSAVTSPRVTETALISPYGTDLRRPMLRAEEKGATSGGIPWRLPESQRPRETMHGVETCLKKRKGSEIECLYAWAVPYTKIMGVADVCVKDARQSKLPVSEIRCTRLWFSPQGKYG